MTAPVINGTVEITVQSASTVTSATINLPSGGNAPVEGEKMLCLVSTRTNVDATTMDEGWSLVEHTTAGAFCDDLLFEKTATSSESDPTITFTTGSRFIASVLRTNGSTASVTTVSDDEPGSGSNIVNCPASTATADALVLYTATVDATFSGSYASVPTGTAVVNEHNTSGVYQSIYKTTGVSGAISADTYDTTLNYRNVGRTIVVNESGISVTGITPDPVITDSTANITGTLFESVQGTGTVTQTINAVTIEASAYASWADTAIECTSVDVETDLSASEALKYGSHTFTVTTDGAASDTFVRDVAPVADNAFVDLVAPLATSGNRITAVSDLANDDQVRYEALLQQGGSPTAFTVTVNSDASFSIGGDPPDGTYAFEVRVWDTADKTWGTAADQTVIIGDVSTGRGIVRNIVRSTVKSIVRSISG